MGCKILEDIKIPKQLQNPEFRFLLLRPKGKEPLPQMKGWQKNNVPFNNPVLKYHLEEGGNYAIIGGYGNLVMIDGDSKEISDIAETLPPTFTVKTGSPEEYKKHYFFITDVQVKPIRFSKVKMGDLGDVRSVGQYVVAPNSIHPSGNAYKVLKDLPIIKISEARIREVFQDYIDKTDNTKFKEYPVETKLRNSRFIRECNVPDYCINNKLPGGTSKNWKLFPYLVDILHNREVSLEVYKNLISKQDHNPGAIRGWIKKAREGKLAKTSCKKMREYLEKFHPKQINKICGDCPLYKKIKEIKKIKHNQNYTELQKEIFTALALKDKNKATELIVKQFEEENFIYSTKDDIKSEMWVYDNGIYVPHGKSFVKEFCRKLLLETFTPQLANNITAKIEADTYIEHDEFFNTNYIDEVPLKNGILNIFTRELTPFNSSKIFFNKLPIIYNPAAECEEIIKHLNTVLPTEREVKVVLELFGYLLLKEYKIEKAIMFIGHGRNGKSKTIELMKLFIGVKNCSSLPLRSINEESFSLGELFGKMANLSADLSKTDLKETGMIKSLIGRDLITAKRKYLRDLNFVNHAKMIFSANELPKIYDTTDGFWTKWVLIEFPYKFVTQKVYDKDVKEEEKHLHKIMNPDIMKKLTTEEELSGLLNLALDGLDNLIKEKDFSYSKNTQQVRDMWIRQSDSFMAFCFDHIKEDAEGIVSKKDLRKWYHKYHKKHKVSGCSDKSIHITLENMFGVSESQTDRFDRFWEGISLIHTENL